MSRLLYVNSSPRNDRSYSSSAAAAFLEAYRAANPEDEIEKLDLWTVELPRFAGETLAAKYATMRKLNFTAEQEASWSAVLSVIDHFTSFDKMVFSIPMWNFNVPYVLKHYIDILVQPSVTYGIDAQGKLGGFIRGKKAICMCAAGSLYDEGAPLAPPVMTGVRGHLIGLPGPKYRVHTALDHDPKQFGLYRRKAVHVAPAQILN